MYIKQCKVEYHKQIKLTRKCESLNVYLQENKINIDIYQLNKNKNAI